MCTSSLQPPPLSSIDSCTYSYSYSLPSRCTDFSPLLFLFGDLVIQARLAGCASTSIFPSRRGRRVRALDTRLDLSRLPGATVKPAFEAVGNRFFSMRPSWCAKASILTTAVRFSSLHGLSNGRCVALNEHPPEKGRYRKPSKALVSATSSRRRERARRSMKNGAEF